MTDAQSHTGESAGEGGDASALFRRFDDEFRNAYRERKLYADDRTLQEFLIGWLVGEIARLQKFDRAQETARRGLRTLMTPFVRADAALVAIGHSINHAQYYFGAVRTFAQDGAFVLYPWITLESASMALEACHSACLGYWVYAAPAAKGAGVAEDVQGFVRASVGATLMTIGWPRSR